MQILDQLRITCISIIFNLLLLCSLAHSYILDLTPKSKIERYFEPEIWAKLIADRPATAKPQSQQQNQFISNPLFRSPSTKAPSFNLCIYYTYTHPMLQTQST